VSGWLLTRIFKKYTLPGITHKARFPTAPISSPANCMKWSWLSLWQATKAQRGAEIYLYSFFKRGARLGEQSQLLNACRPGKETQYPLYRRLGRLQVQKILLPLVLEPQAAHIMVSHYTDCHMQLVTTKSQSVLVDMVTTLHNKLQKITSSLHSAYTIATLHSRKEQALQVLHYNRLYEVLGQWQFFLIEKRIIELISL